jgi:hypothetical protein
MSEESAQLVTSITKGQARDLIQRSLPVPDNVLRAHSSSLLNIALRHQQMRAAVGLPVDVLACMAPSLVRLCCEAERLYTMPACHTAPDYLAVSAMLQT